MGLEISPLCFKNPFLSSLIRWLELLTPSTRSSDLLEMLLRTLRGLWTTKSPAFYLSRRWRWELWSCWTPWTLAWRRCRTWRWEWSTWWTPQTRRWWQPPWPWSWLALPWSSALFWLQCALSTTLATEIWTVKLNVAIKLILVNIFLVYFSE